MYVQHYYSTKDSGIKAEEVGKDGKSWETMEAAEILLYRNDKEASTKIPQQYSSLNRT